MLQQVLIVKPEDRGGNHYWGLEHSVYIRRQWMHEHMWTHFCYSVIGAGQTVDDRFMSFENFAKEFSTAQIMTDGTINFFGRGCNDAMVPQELML